MPGSTRTGEGGWSLLGVMIGAAVGLLVLAGASQIYVQSYRDSVAVIEKTDLNQELRYLIQFMADDIRRAGSRFWEPPANAGKPVSDYRNNPFWQYGNNLSVRDYNGETDACILFAYDLDGDSSVGVKVSGAVYEDEDNRERFGFRWGDGGSVKARTGGGDPFNCSDGSWESVSDPHIRIDRLEFTLTATQTNLSNPGNPCASGDWCAQRRVVDITLEGSPQGASRGGYAVETTVTVRNDRVFQL